MDIYSVLESIGCESLFDDFIAEESTLSAKERRELPDEAFGLPSQRKYPMKTMQDGKLKYDETHIRQAIAFFHFCPTQDRDELSRNICKALKESKIQIEISEKSVFYPYYKKYYK